jgi:hypothetical protein
LGWGLGLVGAYFVGRAMQSMLFGVKALDVLAFASVGLVLMASALLACYPAGATGGVDSPDAGAADGVRQPASR